MNLVHLNFSSVRVSGVFKSALKLRKYLKEYIRDQELFFYFETSLFGVILLRLVLRPLY